MLNRVLHQLKKRKQCVKEFISFGLKGGGQLWRRMEAVTFSRRGQSVTKGAVCVQGRA